MKKIFIFTIASLSFWHISCMDKTKSLVEDIKQTIVLTEKILKKNNFDPRELDIQNRSWVNDHLIELKSSAEKLRLILNNTDGWITEESEK